VFTGGDTSLPFNMAMNLSSCCAKVEFRAEGTISAIPKETIDKERSRKTSGFEIIITAKEEYGLLKNL
jgi:hypothetical protein